MGGALAPPLFEQKFMYYYMGLLKIDEILVVFTVIIVRQPKVCNKFGKYLLEIADFNAFLRFSLGYQPPRKGVVPQTI